MRICRNDKIAWRTFEDQGVLLNTGSGKVIGLNRTAKRIWELLENGTTAEVVAAQLADEFAVSVEDARVDVDEFVESLSSRGLLLVEER